MTLSHSSGLIFRKSQDIDATQEANRIVERGLHLRQVRNVGVDGSGQIRQLVLNCLATFGITIEHTDG
jgi:hypothetical protein